MIYLHRILSYCSLSIALPLFGEDVHTPISINSIGYSFRDTDAIHCIFSLNVDIKVKDVVSFYSPA